MLGEGIAAGAWQPRAAGEDGRENSVREGSCQPSSEARP